MGRTGSGLRGSWLRLPWGRMRVWRGGEGPLLLAVHGLGGSGRYWEGLARRVGHRFQVLAPDLAGFGRSDKPAVDYDRAFHVGNLEAVVEDTGGAGPVVVVAHSLGAVLAALWASGHPGDLAALALAAGAFPSGEGPPDWAVRPPTGMRVAVTVARAAWPVVGVPVGVARGYPAGVVADFGRQRLHSRIRTLDAAIWDPDAPAALEVVRAIPTTAPVLLVNAADDRTVPHGDQARWADLLPHAERRTLDEGGHQFLLRTDFEPLAGWLLALPER
ncbi:MAG TPA: alpha/beta fold hydrolase [Actinomycetota bacterium]|nr:alpha/beta fold hydrolase [Actinomycetota bacterium]